MLLLLQCFFDSRDFQSNHASSCRPSSLLRFCARARVCASAQPKVRARLHNHHPSSPVTRNKVSAATAPRSPSSDSATNPCPLMPPCSRPPPPSLPSWSIVLGPTTAVMSESMLPVWSCRTRHTCSKCSPRCRSAPQVVADSDVVCMCPCKR